jgi:hypothetical protein
MTGPLPQEAPARSRSFCPKAPRGTVHPKGEAQEESNYVGTMNANCPICRGIGWVCERHPDRLYDSEQGCACGYGAPCGCNESTPSDTSQVIVIAEETVH